MRLSSVLMRVLVFLAAAVACFASAQVAVSVVEDRSRVGVYEALLDADHDWVSVQSDGLQIVLEGSAPSEADRFRAMSVAGTVVDSSRVIDNMRVADSGLDIAPRFEVEMLRNDDGVSLIGLMPAITDRDAVTQQVGRIAGDLPVADLLDVADYPPPDTWAASMDFALHALRLLPRSKISVSAEAVAITAVSDSAAQKARWETELRQRRPAGVTVGVEISAPRPVITPFTLRFAKTPEGVEMPACSADTEEAQTRILTAAHTAGLSGRATCPLGLGVPSGTWAEAATQSIAAINALGGGTVTLSDADITLIAAQDTPQPVFDDVIGRLQNSLPDVFSLNATLPETPDPSAGGPPEFVATLSPEGMAQLRGKVEGAMMNATAETYAKARFGQGSVSMATRIVEDGSLPPGWSVRVLAGLEALSHLGTGAVVVQPDHVSVSGRTGHEDAEAAISRLLISKLGADASFEVQAVYDEALDPLAGLPTPAECVAKIVAINAASKITFDPGSANIVAGGRRIMDDIAEVLRQCPDLPMQIAGYTDSQGRDEMNRQLSQRRAEAVVTALRDRRIPTSSFTAVGFGADNPIGDNDTAEGREANRRIEFSLIGGAQDPAPEETGDAGDDAPPEGDAPADPADAAEPPAGDTPPAEPEADPAPEAEPAPDSAAPAPADEGGASVEVLSGAETRPRLRPDDLDTDAESGE